MAEDNSIKYIIDHISNYPGSIAILLKKLYGKEFRLVSDNKKNPKLIWQEFVEGSWKPMIRTFELHKRLIGPIARCIEVARADIRSQLLKSQDIDSNKHEFLISYMRELIHIEHNLYKITFRNKVIRECELLFYERTESA